MRYTVLMFLCLIAVIAYVQRLGIQSAHTPIEKEFAIDTEDFGTLGTALLVGYALMQIPSGWLADRLGSRNALASFAIAWSVIAMSIGLCERFETLEALWFVMGLALAGIFPCAAKSIGAWFADTEKATASGLLGSVTMLGTGVASLLTAWLLIDAGWSWRLIYVFYGAAGVIWTVAYLALIPERAVEGIGAAPMTRDDWARLFTSVPLWLLCGQQFFRAGAMIFFINWFPKFLKESRSFDDKDAAFHTACVNGAALVGGVLGGFFSDWLFRRTGLRRLSRQGIAVVGMSAAAALVLGSYFIGSETIAVAVFAAAAFIATFGGVSGYTVAIEFGGRRIGIVFSLMNMAGNIAAAIVNQVIGALKQRTGSWDNAVFVIAAVFIVDAICWALLNPHGPLFEDHHEPG